MVLKRQKVSYATRGEIRKFQCPQGRYFYEPQIPTAFGSLYGIGADFNTPWPFKKLPALQILAMECAVNLARRNRGRAEYRECRFGKAIF